MANLWRVTIFCFELVRYLLNTCVDPPHNEKVTGLTFQPSLKRSSRWSGQQHPVLYMAITTSLDGRFKSWVLVDEEGEGEGEERKRKKIAPSWACRSVGYYHNLPCLGAAFSQDGSLLALNFKKVSHHVVFAQLANGYSLFHHGYKSL